MSSSEFDIREVTSWAEMARAEATIPEFEQAHSPERFRARLEGRPFLALVAYHGSRVAGYKIGYGETESRFYSWVGGVHPDFRGQGLAREMLRHQEIWCRRQGYRSLAVKSENRFRGMLIFLLKEGYDIHALSQAGQISFLKSLE